MADASALVHSNYKKGEALDAAKHYIVESHIDGGKFGDVKLCSNGYAVKILVKCSHPGKCTRNDCRARQIFANEKRYFDSMTGKSHPNLVKVYHMFKTQDEFHCLTMDCLKGLSLHEKRRNYQGYLPENYAAFVAQNIYSGLAYLETVLKIRNLDLKPANIMQKDPREVDDWISSPWVLVDFGLSGEIEKDQTSIVLESVVGSPPYLSPERLDKEIHEASNIYTTGSMLFEVIVGLELHRAPDNSISGIVKTIRDRGYVPKEIKNHLKSKVSPLCTSHVEKSLAFEPVNRFPLTVSALKSEWITQFKTAENKYDFSKMPEARSQQQTLPHRSKSPPRSPGRPRTPSQIPRPPTPTSSRMAGASTGPRPGSPTKKASSVQSGSGPAPSSPRPQSRRPVQKPVVIVAPKTTNPPSDKKSSERSDDVETARSVGSKRSQRVTTDSSTQGAGSRRSQQGGPSNRSNLDKYHK